jgi:AMP nucleosidase
MLTKLEITRNWLPRYTGMPLDKFGEYILLTNFHTYVQQFASSLIAMFTAKTVPCKLLQTQRA